MTLRLAQIDLHRTFSIPKDQTEDSEDLSHFFGRGSDALTWKNLHEKPLTVVVGEAGIGKTIEFKNEVQRLQEDGQKSFFIELNQLDGLDSWELALGQSASAYEVWQSSLEEGYFFLDAVDEARLSGHAAFKKALMVVHTKLFQHLARVRIAISSRWTDWSIDEVRTAVDELLADPIAAARPMTRMAPEGDFDGEAPSCQFEQPSAMEQPEVFVVKLDPLSRLEAQKLAEAWSVMDAPIFWDAVDDGQYDFMATRPLDLRWMVNLWNQKRSLGTYLELIEGNVVNRLTETNPSYQTTSIVLSLDRLRMGADDLAAAAVFSGHAFIATVSTSPPRPDEVTPQTVLTDWNSTEITRLLASAVFDEATFGRVKFHHRSVREYLAACWVHRQLTAGVPLHRVLPLFAASPFGETILIPARRWTLCWLASINVKVREWVMRHFPEMLFFDGDPEAWDNLSADHALLGYVQQLKNGMRTDWHNDVSEYRRIGRRLNSDRLAALLADPQLPAYVKTALYPIVTHARLTGCAEAIFAIYANQATPARERRDALEVLATIATPEQRTAIKADLLSGALTSNKLIASALVAADWKSLTADELSQVFASAGNENSYGGGPMALSIKFDLLPSATADSAALLLEAVVAMLPQPEDGKQFTRQHESDQSERAWLMDVLSDCFERLLTLLPTTLFAYPIVCLKAGERIEALRDTEFTSRDEFSRLHGLIAEHPGLRWQLGLAIALSKDISHATNRLTWDESWCIVSFGAADMPELVMRANDLDTSPDKRAAWFTLAKDVAFRHLRGPARKTTLAALASGPESEARTEVIAEQRAQFINGSQQRRSWNSESRQRKREQLARHEANRAKFSADIEHIRDATARGYLNWLVHYSYDHSGRKSITHVNYEVIARDFGQDIADALADGLKVAWSRSGTPNPVDHPNGSVPWEALTALAGLHTLLTEGLDIANLTGKEAARASRLAVWEFNGPPSWFEPLVAAHKQEVCEALHPWICSEALSAPDTPRLRGALEVALRCSTTVRAILLLPLVAMVTSATITRPKVMQAVVEALFEDGLIDQSTMADLCCTILIKSIATDGLIKEIRWLRTWMEADTHSAWTWFEAHIAGLGATASVQVSEFAKAMDDCNWVKIPPADDTTVQVLLRLHALLSRHMPLSPAPGEAKGHNGFGPPIAQLREAIPRVLVQQIRGVTAHRALSQLADEEVNPHDKDWLHYCIHEHAALEVGHSTQVEPSALRMIGTPFLTEPRNETQLFQQVVARLKEIKKGLEEGPFSDRELFSAGMPEKKLQLWLAARFLDTQNRRFGVHREEDVDADKRTDIQLSACAGNVCVEIKPVDSGPGRSYSANSLNNTLRTQIVGQYLKGFNSRHGILVLFRLDEKTWNIPNGKRCQPFSALLTYLQEQASIIKDETPGVKELTVFGIDCTRPKTL